MNGPSAADLAAHLGRWLNLIGHGCRQLTRRVIQFSLLVALLLVGAPGAFATASPAAAQLHGYDASVYVYDPAASNTFDASSGDAAAAFRGHRIPTPTSHRAIGLFAAAEAGAGSIDTGDVAVYESYNASGEVDYVGVTNNIERRAAEQLADKGITVRPIAGLENLSRSDARAVEQVLIEENGGPGGGQLINKINSIARSNPAYAQQIQRGCGLLTAAAQGAPNVCG